MTWENATITVKWNEDHEQWWAQAGFGERQKSFFIDHPKDDKDGAIKKAHEYLKAKGDVAPISQSLPDEETPEASATPEPEASTPSEDASPSNP